MGRSGVGRFDVAVVIVIEGGQQLDDSILARIIDTLPTWSFRYMQIQ